MSHPGNRPDTEITEERDAEIWQLRVEGKLTQAKIAAQIGVTQAAVSRSLARTSALHASWFTDRARQVKEEQTEQLVEAAFEAWEAWQKSKRDAVTYTNRRENITKETKAAGTTDTDTEAVDPENIPGLYLADDGEEVPAEERARKIFEFALSQGKPGGVLVKDVTTSTVEGRTGDPRHLDNYLKALEHLRKIWGASAPQKTEVTGAEGGAILLKHFEYGLERVYGEAES